MRLFTAKNNFHARKDGRDKLYGYCKKCHNAQARKWRKANPKLTSAQARKQNYGLDNSNYQRILLEQSGRCAICREIMARADVDHDHVTQKVRGLLCHRCNSGLGYFKDSEVALAAAIEYLRKSKEQT